MYYCLLLILMFSTQAFNFFHQEAGADINAQLSLNGFSQLLQVYTGSPPVPRQCLIHGADSKVYINYEPTMNGWNSAAYYDDILHSWTEFFSIGTFDGSLPVIYDYNYVYAFGISSISCVIGLGRANPIYFISPHLHLTPTDIFFNEQSNSDSLITCELFDNAICSFQSSIVVNDSVIGYSPVQISNIYPYTALPQDIFNQLVLQYYTENYWNTFSICNESCIEIPQASYLIKKHTYVQKTILPITANITFIGTTSFRNLDLSINVINGTIAVKQRSFAITNSFGIFIVWIIMSLVMLFLILSPMVDKTSMPHYYKMFPAVRTLIELLTLLSTSFVFFIPEYYNNFLLEFEWFAYFFMSYQIFISVVGLITLFSSETLPFTRPIHYFFPIIASIYFNLLLSLYDFVEGNPAIIHLIYSFMSNNYFFAVSYCFMFNISGSNRVFMLAVGLVLFVLAAGWTMFSSTYFIIPAIQKILETEVTTMYIMWSIIVLLCACVGILHAWAAINRHHMNRVDKRVKKQKIN